MADTIQNIKLTANTWINLYAASGITVGVQIVAENLTAVSVKLHTSATQPSAADAQSNENGSFSVLLAYGEEVNKTGDSGAWAYSHSDGLLNVKVF